MRLSHRRKRASKHGLYWPSRTKQARERIEEAAAFTLKVASALQAVIDAKHPENKAAQALRNFGESLVRFGNGIKSWLMNRDTSQRESIYD
ncbi:hypothetical protein CRN37_09445 [Vibrio vulnificus]|uniref:hypothetical protein n=1 Tax=Vibrio vulnificus TaxID=672 RepID=UPI000CD05BF9|nr:hypothetical protein [Vibrio vulnificus]POC58480.1 hypothetical protein CRN37_09445 [Vibrio vulnificus]POC73050.1 hypothetical protein CRN34_09285 [Vibrio vulnificus]